VIGIVALTCIGVNCMLRIPAKRCVVTARRLILSAGRPSQSDPTTVTVTLPGRALSYMPVKDNSTSKIVEGEAITP